MFTYIYQFSEEFQLSRVICSMPDGYLEYETRECIKVQVIKEHYYQLFVQLAQMFIKRCNCAILTHDIS